MRNRSHSLLLALAVLAAVPAGAVAASYDVTLYGRTGTFGSLGSTVPSGQSLTKVSVPGWQFQPGQAAWFPALARDGSVVIANLTQSGNPLVPTAGRMVISIFAPGVPRLSHLVIDAAFGGDVDDIEVVPDLSLPTLERIKFISAFGSIVAQRPAFGEVYDANGAGDWRPRSLSTTSDLRASGPAGTAACPVGANGVATCQGFSEFALLPFSKKLPIAQYFGGVAVVSVSGRVEAHYPLPTYRDANGNVITLSPREIDVDRRSAAGDEHFVVIYDNGYSGWAQCQAIQEFRYDDGAKRITPVSAPLFPSSPSVPACQPFVSPGQTLGAQYDGKGNLWVMRSRGIAGGPVGIYRRNPQTGHRDTLEGPCGAQQTNGYGHPCPIDLVVTTTPWHVHLLEDQQDGTMYVITVGGRVVPIGRSDSPTGEPFLARPQIDLGIGQLCGSMACGTAPALPIERRQLMKAAIDRTRRALWIPVRTFEDCDRVDDDPQKPCKTFLGYPSYTQNVERNQWLFRVRLPGGGC